MLSVSLCNAIFKVYPFCNCQNVAVLRSMDHVFNFYYHIELSEVSPLVPQVIHSYCLRLPLASEWILLWQPLYINQLIVAMCACARTCVCVWANFGLFVSDPASLPSSCS